MGLRIKAHATFDAKIVLLLGLIAIALPAHAQLQIGENTRVSATGSLSFGYNGEYGESSDHGLGFGGQGVVNGSYYNPKFLSFQLTPFYNRSQANSDSQSVTSSSGVAGEVTLFGGSKMPGTISYYSDSDKSGTFGIPNSAGLTTTGNDHGFGVSWSENLGGVLPPLSVSLNHGISDSSVIGTAGKSESTSTSLMISSRYKLFGFRLGGSFNWAKSHSKIDELISASQTAIENESTMSGVNLTAQHSLPLRGSFSTQYSRVQFDQDYISAGQTTSGNANVIGANVTLQPFRRVSLSGDAEYTNNLSAGLEREIVNSSGQLVPLNNSLSSGTRFDASTFVNVTRDLYVIGYANHATDSYAGVTYASTTYGASGNYDFSHIFLNGLSVHAGMVDNATQQGNSNAGFQGSVNYRRKISSWITSGNFHYSQNVQTLLSFYTTSSMGYGANAQRRFGRGRLINFNMNGGHTGFTGQPGTLSHNENYNTYLIMRLFSVSGGYSRSYGQSLLTAAGLVSNPGLPAGIVSSSSVVSYSGSSYNVGGGTTLFRSMSLSAGYSIGHSGTSNVTVNSAFDTSSAYARLHYRVRKVIFDAGYSRFLQTSQSSTVPHSVLNSYFVGVSRWFSFF